MLLEWGKADASENGLETIAFWKWSRKLARRTTIVGGGGSKAVYVSILQRSPYLRHLIHRRYRAYSR